MAKDISPTTAALLSDLDLTKEELRDRIIEKLTRDLLSDTLAGDDDGLHEVPSAFAKKVEEVVVKAIDARVQALGDQHVIPKVAEIVENLTIQRTNEWGEKKGKPFSFVEYLIDRANTYMQEQVNSSGESQAQSRDGYNWRASTTRIVYAVNKHLHDHMEAALKQALSQANSAVSLGLEKAVKMALAEVSSKLSIKVSP